MFSTISTSNSIVSYNTSINFPQILTVVINTLDNSIIISFNPPPRIDISINSYTSTAIIEGVVF
jgi:hypothetical protein